MTTGPFYRVTKWLRDHKPTDPVPPDLKPDVDELHTRFTETVRKHPDVKLSRYMRVLLRLPDENGTDHRVEGLPSGEPGEQAGKQILEERPGV